MSDLIQGWLDFWNGELDLAEKIVHEDFVWHVAPLTGGPSQDHTGREGLVEWVRGSHQTMPGLKFTVEVGPISQEPFHVVRWLAEAGAVSFHGTDVLRVVDGRIAEYWLNADGLWAAQQLGIMPKLS
ncbi:nuclear transport factor 2 family protein [Lentzea sp. BCCO 10_0061]|uniref:Nuclear transport factor 2 family protein n=1 Tax=Lentzea sokolovensis TaxID=3095429 RepID=A0ABU4V8H9_9PSEU|nr:nuclear transport factor 2 family protein [Lentzea sp. BCCO 10_0061]MDX8147662.1 nuclear transport factor 2 family protein [Lentzea sp. BCCO 10_0061]